PCRPSLRGSPMILVTPANPWPYPISGFHRGELLAWRKASLRVKLVRMNSSSRERRADAGADPPSIPRTLVVTNDFPPRVGGVQQYVWNLVANLPANDLAVLAPNWPGWRDHDAAATFAIHRWPASFLWPTEELGRRIDALVREHDA